MQDKDKTRDPKRRGGIGKSLYILLMAALCFVMLFSAYKVISISLDYNRGEVEYNDIHDSFVRDYTTVFVPKRKEEPIETETSASTDASSPDAFVTDTTEPQVTQAPETTSQEEDVLVIPSIDSAYLKSVNPDYKGWLYVDGIVINYPVVQCADNEYYLDHTFYRQKNSNGCLFIDYRLDLEEDNYNTIIYGHAMKTGAMFGLLSRYAWPGFYEQNKHIVYVTEKGPYLITVFSSYTVSTDSDAWRVRFEDEEDYAEWLKSIKSASEVRNSIVPKTTDRIVTLTTCSFKFEDARFVAHGIIEPLF